MNETEPEPHPLVTELERWRGVRGCRCAQSPQDKGDHWAVAFSSPIFASLAPGELWARSLHPWRDVLLMFFQGSGSRGQWGLISPPLPTPSWHASTLWPCPGLKCPQRVPPISVKQGRREWGTKEGEGSREGGRLSRSRHTLDQQHKLQLGPGSQKRTDPVVSPRTIPD